MSSFDLETRKDSLSPAPQLRRNRAATLATHWIRSKERSGPQPQRSIDTSLLDQKSQSRFLAPPSPMKRVQNQVPWALTASCTNLIETVMLLGCEPKMFSSSSKKQSSYANRRSSSVDIRTIKQSWSHLKRFTNNKSASLRTSPCASVEKLSSSSMPKIAPPEEKMQHRCDAVRKREQFKNSASGRSMSAPPRKRWFGRKGKGDVTLDRGMSASTTFICDEITKRLVGAIAIWHDIHSNLLQLSIDYSSESSMSMSSSSSWSLYSRDSDADEERRERDGLRWHKDADKESPRNIEQADESRDDTSEVSPSLVFDKSRKSRHSLSSPELTAIQLEEMFPEIPEYWRFRTGLVDEVLAPHGVTLSLPERKVYIEENKTTSGCACAMLSRRAKSRDDDVFLPDATPQKHVSRAKANDCTDVEKKEDKKAEKERKKNAKKMQSMPLRKKSEEHNNNVKIRKFSARIMSSSGGEDREKEERKEQEKERERARKEEKRIQKENKREGKSTDSSPARKVSEGRFLPAALRSPGAILRRKKKPLGPSLSWDPERHSKGSTSGDESSKTITETLPGKRTRLKRRSRIHSDGSDAERSEEEDRSDLEYACAHCALLADYKKKLLKTEIESAVMRLARRLGSTSGRTWVRGEQHNRSLKMDAPDIVVSSISSEDEENTTENTTGSENFSSLQTSEASSPCSSTSPSPQIQRNENDVTFDTSEESQECLVLRQHGLQLRPPKLLSPYPDSSSPPRSNSVDLSTLRRDIELLSVSSGDSDGESSSDFDPPTPADSIRTVRSRSHDPAPSPENFLRRPSRIEHLSELFRKALAKSPVVRRTAEQEHRTVNKHRTSRYWLDEQILPSEHIWLPSTGPGSSASADNDCYLGDKGGCERTGEKRRCAACHLVAHTACFPLLAKMNQNCKCTFREHGRKYSSKEIMDGLTMHHWIHKWKHEGRCNRCGKSFQQKIFFHQKEKEPVAVTCSWCKESYHTKNCFDQEKVAEKCDRGSLRDMIVPPGWILRLPNRKRNKHRQKNAGKKPVRQFIVKPIDMYNNGPSQPLIVFVNPKSGGNKGSKALHTLCWLLNPRQVFDITSLKGPKFGLEVYRKIVTQLRLLVCGGDGTVGWVLQTLDQLNWATYPPMALLPLGTGNDLSRCMGWGGSFSDEPLSQLLHAILHESSVTHLDRWRINVEPNLSTPLDSSDDLGDAVQSSLPLTVMNNYFSIGADAHVALQFHHSRSANPQMLNSRLKNRIAYGGLGTIDLFKRSWKDLSDYVRLECDGVDLTPRIKELKLHCILFHNITYYAGGTVPWPTDGDDQNRPSSCDGKIEVLGFTTATLAALQMGGKGERLAQCSSVRVVTSKAIPMQVDGEPCLLAPSLILLQFHSKVPMLRREKKSMMANHVRKGPKWNRASDHQLTSTSLIMQLPVIVVGRHDYDTYKDAFERLKDTAFEIGMISVEAETDLEQSRNLIHKLLTDHPCLPYEYTQEWRFLDYVTNAEEGTFRVSRHAEHIQSVSDICNPDECLLILDDAFPSITSRGAAIATDLVFSPKHPSGPQMFPPTKSSPMVSEPRRTNQRRISETLRIVLSSDAQETHL